MKNPLKEQRDYGGNQIDKDEQEIQQQAAECRDGFETVDQISKACEASLEMKIFSSQVSKKRRYENIETRPEHECSKNTQDGYESEC